MKHAFISILFSTLVATAPAFAKQPGEKLISLNVRQERTVPQFGMKIKFLDVLEDSRCPEGRQCVWAGNAKVRIAVWTGRQKPLIFEVNSGLKPQVVNYGRYEIGLAALDPKPTADNGKPDKGGYQATFTIRRLVK